MKVVTDPGLTLAHNVVTSWPSELPKCGMPCTCFGLARAQMLNKCLAVPTLIGTLRRAIPWVWLLLDAATVRIARVKWSIHHEIRHGLRLNWHSRALTAVATYTIARDHAQFYLSIDQER